jgi:PKD domain
VKPSFRLFPLPAGSRTAYLRRLTVALLAPVLATLAFVAAPAQAHVVEVGGTKFGVQRHSAPARLFENEELEPQTFANAGGNPVLHQSSTYAIFWDPTYRYLDPWTEVIDQFFQNMSSASGSLASVFAVDTQYTDKTNKPAFYKSAFRGSYADKAPYPSPAGCKDPNPLVEGAAVTCITDKQIRAQLESFISNEKLPKGMGTVYYLLTPPGVTVCTDEGAGASHCSSNSASSTSFCSYHAAITPTNPTTGDASTILYGVIPWTAGGLGDPLLGGGNQTPGYDCQDGGFDPTSKPLAEEKETAKVDAKAEEEKRRAEETKKRAGAEAEENREKTTYEEAFEKGLISAKEKEEKEEELKEHRKEREAAEKIAEKKAEKTEREAREKKELLEGPHQEEPNQTSSPDQTSCPNAYDGGCDVGLADIIVTQIASEQQSIVTDPLLNGWQDKNHNEVVDECRNLFGLVTGGSVGANEESVAGTLFNQTLGTGSYYLNDVFNAAAFRIYQPSGACLNHANLAPSFTAPTPVNAGEIVGLNGLESNVELDAAVDFPGGGPEKLTYATFTWNFGDGSPEVSGFAPGAPPCSEAPWLTPCAASVFHSYKYGGIYEVTLKVRDVGGNEASVSHLITVDGPTPPSPSSGGSSSSATEGSASASSASGSGSSSSSGVTIKPPALGPVASQAVLSSSLSKTLRGGLVVRYSVSQQVTGHFEVLLAASIAHSLGLHSPLATGLPQGTPAQMVIAKALLVTTSAGRNTLKIQFGRITARRLRRLHTVPLMLRLNLRNAGGGTTTVLSKITLH